MSAGLLLVLLAECWGRRTEAKCWVRRGSGALAARLGRARQRSGTTMLEKGSVPLPLKKRKQRDLLSESIVTMCLKVRPKSVPCHRSDRQSLP